MDNLTSAEKSIQDQRVELGQKKEALHTQETNLARNISANKESAIRQSEAAISGTLDLSRLEMEANQVQITSSAQLEQQLAAGYKTAGVAKAEKDQWEQNLRKQIAEAKAQEEQEQQKQRHRQAQDISLKERVKITRDALAYLKEGNLASIERLTELMNGTINQGFVDLSKLIGNENQQISNLALFIQELQNLDMKKLDDNYANLLGIYNSIEGLNSGIYKEHMDAAGDGMHQVGYAMMLSAAVKKLNELVVASTTQILTEEENVNLQIMAISTELISSEILVSEEYQTQVSYQFGEKTEKISAAEEDLDRQEKDIIKAKNEIIEARKELIRTGGSETEKISEKEWKLSEYADQIIEELGEKSLLEMEKKEFDKLIVTYNDNILANEVAIADVLTGYKESNILLSNEWIFDSVKMEMKKSMKDSMFKHNYQKESINSDTTAETDQDASKIMDSISVESFERFMSDHKCMERIQKLTEGLPEYCYYAFVKSKEVMKSLLEADDDKVDGVIAEYKDRMSKNEETVRNWIKSNSYSKNEAYLEMQYNEILKEESFIVVTGVQDELLTLLGTYVDIFKSEGEIIEDRKELIRTGGIEDEDVRAKQWKLSEYADEIIEKLGEKSLLEMDQDEFDKLIATYNDNILANESAIADALNKYKYYYPILQNELILDGVKDEIREFMKERMYTDSYKIKEFVYRDIIASTEIDYKTDWAMFDIANVCINKYKEDNKIDSRLNKLLAVFPYGCCDTLIQNKEIMENLIKAKDDEVEGVVKKYREQMLANEFEAKKWLKSNAHLMDESSFDALYDDFREKHGKDMLTSSLEGIKTLMERYLAVLPATNKELDLNRATVHEKAIKGNSEDTSYLGRIREVLFNKETSPELATGLAGYEDKVMASLVKLINSGYFSDYGLKIKSTITDFNSLKLEDVSEIFEQLKSTMMENLPIWLEDKSDDMLIDMMSLPQHEFVVKYTKYKDRIAREEAFKKVELQTELQGVNCRKKRVVYRYDQQTKSTAVGTKASRAQRRTARFDQAREFKTLLFKNLGAEGVEIWKNFLNLKAVISVGQIVNDIKEGKIYLGLLYRSTRGFGKVVKDYFDNIEKIKEYKDLAEILKDIDDLACELLMCQNEEWLVEKFGKEANTYEVKEYNELLFKRADEGILFNESKFWEIADTELKNTVGYPENVLELHDRVLALLTQYDNKQFEEKSEVIKAAVKSFKEGFSEESQQYSQLRDSRIDRMKKEFGEEAVSAILPMLSKKKDVYMCISCHSDEDFEVLYTKLSTTVLPAAVQIWNTYFNVEEYFYQILEATFDSIYDGRLKEEDWENRFTDIFCQLKDSAFVGIISKRVEKLQKDKNLAKYSYYIVDNLSTEQLNDDKEFKEAIKPFKTNIDTNTAMLNKVMANETENKVILSISVEMTLRDRFATELISEEAFKEKLDFIKAKKAEEDKQDETSRKVMTTRKEKYDYVTELRSKSQVLLDNRHEHMQEHALNQSLGITPMINLMFKNRQAANKNKKLGDEDKIKSAEEVIDRLYGAEPDYKRDVLKQIAMVRNEYRKTLGNKDVQSGEVGDQFKIAIDIADETIYHVVQALSTDDRYHRSLQKRILSVFGAGLVGDIKGLTVSDITKSALKACEEFIPKYRYQARLMSLSADIKKHPILLSEYEHMMVAYSYDVISDDKEEFCKKADEEYNYFSRALKTVSELEPLTNGNEKMLAGLYRCFYSEILTGEGYNLDQIKAKASEIIDDKDMAEMVQRSESMLGSANNLTVEEQGQTLDIENFVIKVNAGSDKFMKSEFASYTNEEVKLFALAAQFSDAMSNGAGMDIVSDLGFAKKASKTCAQAIIDYRAGKTIAAPDYFRAYSALCVWGLDTSNSINPMVFNKAQEFVELCQEAKLSDIRDQNIALGADPMQSIKAINPDNPATDLNNITIETPQDVVDKLVIKAQEEKAEDLAKALGEIGKNAYKQRLLILVLQNRSVVDYSTEISRLDRAHGVKSVRVNEEGREELLGLMGGGIEEKLSLKGDMLHRAYLQAFSYQKKDEDGQGKDNYIKRKTALDINMLEEAVSLVDEMLNQELRLYTVRSATTEFMIRKSGNQKAIEALDRKENRELSIDQFIHQECMNDSKQALYAGYLGLDDREKRLFFNAISKRDLLDISKNDIMWNRFGMKDREYVNEAGRFELIDQYIENTMEPVSERSVFLGLLSSQIDDSMNFIEGQDLNNSEVMDGVSSRKTAVDWKLFARALQLVHRSRNERQLTDQQKELQNVLGTLSETGAQTMDNSYMRRNIHNAGTRFTRFLSRRVVDELKDQVPDYMLTMVRFMLPRGAADYVSDLSAFGEDDDEFEFSIPGIVKFSSDVTERASNLANEDVGVSDAVQAIGKHLFVDNKFEEFSDSLDELSGNIGLVNSGLEILQGLANTVSLFKAGRKDEKQAQEDKKKNDEKIENLSAAAKSFIIQALQRNERNLEEGRQNAIARQLDAIFNAIGDMVEDAAEDAIGENFGGIVVKEAIHVVNFIRAYLHDIKNLADFYDVDKSIDAYAQKMKEKGVEVDWKNLNSARKLSLFCDINGYENFTEMAEVVGMNITQSILFSASKLFDGGENEKNVAKAIMAAVGAKEYIGDISPEASEKLCAALMGEER